VFAPDEVVDFDIQVMAYPSPYIDFFNVEITSDYDDEVTISLFDINGSLIELYESVDIHETPEMGRNLPTGMYILSVQQEGVIKTIKVYKLN